MSNLKFEKMPRPIGGVSPEDIDGTDLKPMVEVATRSMQQHGQDEPDRADRVVRDVLHHTGIHSHEIVESVVNNLIRRESEPEPQPQPEQRPQPMAIATGEPVSRDEIEKYVMASGVDVSKVDISKYAGLRKDTPGAQQALDADIAQAKSPLARMGS